MSGRSEKKLLKSKTKTMSFIVISIVVIGLIHLLLTLFFNTNNSITSCLFSIVFLNIISILLYKLLDFFYESMFFMPILDFLIVHSIVMLGVNFHFKFWYFYLVIPGYFIYKGCQMAFNHVKNLDKNHGVEADLPKEKEKIKKKIVKY